MTNVAKLSVQGTYARHLEERRAYSFIPLSYSCWLAWRKEDLRKNHEGPGGPTITRYELKFAGREKGAIGSIYYHLKTVEAQNLEDARLALYETHQDIVEFHVVSQEEVPV